MPHALFRALHAGLPLIEISFIVFGMDMLKTLLFGLVMLAVGISFSGVAAHTSYAYLTSEDWVPVDAKILSVAWDKGRVGQVSGQRGYTGYEAVVLYKYDYAGETYQSQQVRLKNRKTSRKTQERAFYNKLKSHQKSGAPVSVLVNPRVPNQAVMYRNIRWHVVAVQAVVGVIALLLGLAVVKEAFS